MSLWRRNKDRPVAAAESVPMPVQSPPPQPFGEADVAVDMISRMFEGAGISLPGAPARPDTTWRGDAPPPGYLESFLSAEDLPGLTMPEDRRLMRTFNEDGEAFPAARGVVCGLTRWAPDESAATRPPIDRLIDLRWCFADPEAALRWHRERLAANAENMPPLPRPEGLGTECHAFGGLQSDPFGGTFTSFNYLFVVDRVLVKVYVADMSGLGLDASLAAEVAGRAARRASAALAHN